MKQDLGSAAGQKSHSAAHSPAVRPARATKPKESPRGETGHGNPRQVGPEDRTASRAVKKQLPFSSRKVRPNDDPGPPPREREKEAPLQQAAVRHGGWVSEQYAKPRRKLRSEVDGRDGAVRARERELQERLEASEGLVRALRSEVDALQDLLVKLTSLNDELEAQNKQYAEELSAAQVKISSLEKSDRANIFEEEVHVKSKTVAAKLKEVGVTKQPPRDVGFKMPNAAPQFVIGTAELTKQPTYPISFPSLSASSAATQSFTCGPAPPAPPPPPPRIPARPVKTQTGPSVVEFYRSLTRRDIEKVTSCGGGCDSPVNTRAHNSIVDEIQNRSTHLLAIKADVATKADFIRSLIEKVHAAIFTDIEDVSNFVDWLDKELSILADERAVLKHFDWPEKKADAMREAAIEYRVLKQLEIEVCSFADDPSVLPEIAMKKMTNLLDKLERSIQRVTNLRNVASLNFTEFKIPTNWMLDSGMPSKFKLVSIELAKLCMRRVSMELESVRHSERETMQEALLLRCVHFAYRVHQFAGGLDSEAMSVLGELRGRVQSDGCLKRT